MKNQSLQDYLTKLSPTEASDFSLWKATRNLKRPEQSVPPIRRIDGSWARSDQEKADAFAEHLSKVFQPHTMPVSEDEETINLPDSQSKTPETIVPVKPSEIRQIIKTSINAKKSPGYDLITGKIVKELSKKGIMLITAIFNATLRLSHFPCQWKIAQIILIQKPGKNPTEASSYRPISILPVLSKLFEKILLTRLKPYIDDIIPSHQFGFREQHSTVEQIHRVVNTITEAFEKKEYCSAVFIDIAQAFDKVWHKGLVYKLKQTLPAYLANLLEAYLGNRCFHVKFKTCASKLVPIKAGVPQGSVLGPILYTIYTADIPTPISGNTTVATFADDQSVLTSHDDPEIASQNLQIYLNLMEDWLKKWKIKVNETKSSHVTFTLRKKTCPPVKLNNITIPQAKEAKYLGMHLDRRLTWKKHIWTKRKQLNYKFSKMYWLIGRNSQLSTTSKLTIYKTILKPIWTYGIQLWGTASNSNIAILERFQIKTLRTIFNIPWYVKNKYIYSDIGVKTIKGEISNFSVKYQKRLSSHPNYLAVNLLDNSVNNVKRLRRHSVIDLPYRF